MTHLSLLPCLLLLLLSIPLLSLLLKRVTRRRDIKPTKLSLPPGPPRLPIIGNLHQLGASPHLSLHKLSAEHGPLMYLQLGSVPTLVVSTGDAAAEIVRSHDVAFSGRPALYAATRLSYGLRDVAFAPHGEHWRQARKVAVQELLSAQRVQSFRNVRQKLVASLVTSITARASSSSAAIDLSATLLSLMNTMTCRIAFSSDVGGSMHGTLAETQRLLGGFCAADFFPGLKWVHEWTGLRARLERNFEELDRLYDRVIEEHLRREWPESAEDEDLVHVLLRLHRDPNSAATFGSREHIKGLLTDIFIAGTDTSSATLVWAMAELIRNPSAMAAAQQEVRKVFNNSGRVEECNLHQLNYLKLVLKEVLRLHPPAPLLVPRETTEQCTVNGYHIPARTRVFIDAQSIGMDPKYWKDPEEFMPERFLDRNIDFRGQDFNFIPFGIGRRICPGINFGMVVVELVLASLLYHFDWGLPSGMQINDVDMEQAFGITMHKKTPLCLIAYPKQVQGFTGIML